MSDDRRERAMAKVLMDAGVAGDVLEEFLDDAFVAIDQLTKAGWTLLPIDQAPTVEEAAAMVKNHEGELLGLGDTQPVLDGWAKLRRRASSDEGQPS